MDKIEESNTFQQYLKALGTSSGNNKLTTFLENAKDTNSIEGGAGIGKGKRKSPMKYKGTVNRSSNGDVLFTPSINGGSISPILIGSDNSDMRSIYGGMLREAILDKFRTEYENCLKNGKIPVESNSKILTTVEVEDISNAGPEVRFKDMQIESGAPGSNSKSSSNRSSSKKRKAKK